MLLAEGGLCFSTETWKRSAPPLPVSVGSLSGPAQLEPFHRYRYTSCEPSLLIATTRWSVPAGLRPTTGLWFCSETSKPNPVAPSAHVAPSSAEEFRQLNADPDEYPPTTQIFRPYAARLPGDAICVPPWSISVTGALKVVKSVGFAFRT